MGVSISRVKGRVDTSDSQVTFCHEEEMQMDTLEDMEMNRSDEPVYKDCGIMENNGICTNNGIINVNQTSHELNSRKEVDNQAINVPDTKQPLENDYRDCFLMVWND
jgi:hypothetical protein